MEGAAVASHGVSPVACIHSFSFVHLRVTALFPSDTIKDWATPIKMTRGSGEGFFFHTFLSFTQGCMKIRCKEGAS